jgi:hypothetical protein
MKPQDRTPESGAAVSTREKDDDQYRYFVSFSHQGGSARTYGFANTELYLSLPPDRQQTIEAMERVIKQRNPGFDFVAVINFVLLRPPVVKSRVQEDDTQQGFERLDFPGVMDDGTYAPPNTDKARLDWFGRNPGKVKNMKGGVLATDVDTQWQPSVRAAIDAAMEYVRRDLRSRGGNPQW